MMPKTPWSSMNCLVQKGGGGQSTVSLEAMQPLAVSTPKCLYRASETIPGSRRFGIGRCSRFGGKSMKKYLTLALLSLLWVSFARATNYYLRADGTAANKGAAAGPCTTASAT